MGVLAALEHWGATGVAASAERAIAWSRQIADHASGSSLLNAARAQSIHLWGHLQKAALAEVGRSFGWPELVECARATADSLLLPAVDSAFDFARVLPFDVSGTVAGLAAVAPATADERYAAAATRGREWFNGRNNAGRPVYDACRGLVYDGIDHGTVSETPAPSRTSRAPLALLG